jgi:hypothetical protein
LETAMLTGDENRSTKIRRRRRRRRRHGLLLVAGIFMVLFLSHPYGSGGSVERTVKQTHSHSVNHLPPSPLNHNDSSKV